MDDTWSDFDSELSEEDKNYIYLALPMDVDEDSVSVEVFLEKVWARPLDMAHIPIFCSEFRLWVREGMPV